MKIEIKKGYCRRCLMNLINDSIQQLEINLIRQN